MFDKDEQEKEDLQTQNEELVRHTIIHVHVNVIKINFVNHI